jgi:hypothetical protein
MESSPSGDPTKKTVDATAVTNAPTEAAAQTTLPPVPDQKKLPPVPANTAHARFSPGSPVDKTAQVAVVNKVIARLRAL